MTRIELSTRADFTLDTYERIAWGGAGVALSESAMAAMARSRRAFIDLIDGDDPPVVYGVTSGYGHTAKRQLSRDDRKKHAARMPYAIMTAHGEPLPDRVTRGIVFARLTNLIEGHTAITPRLAERVAAMLDDAVQPEVPALGQGGAGEILSLGPLFRNLFETETLEEKDTVSLINGSPTATALICDAALAARKRLALAYDVFALSFEAMMAPMSHIDPALDDLWADPDQVEALGQLRARCEGGAENRRSYQAPVSWRILPRVLGAAERAVRQAEEVAQQSLRAITDNPVVIPPNWEGEGSALRVFSTGGYHNIAAAHALGGLAVAWAELALIAERHTAKIQDGNLSGMPPFLIEGDMVTEPDSIYLGCVGMSSVGFLEQARQAAAPVLMPGAEGGGYGANDVAPPTTLAWRREGDGGSALESCLSNLAVIALRALDVTDRRGAPGQRDFIAWLVGVGARFDRMRPPFEITAPLAAEMHARVYSSERNI